MNKYELHQANAILEAVRDEYDNAYKLAKARRKKAAYEATDRALELMLDFHSLVASHRISDEANRTASQWLRRAQLVFVKNGWLHPWRVEPRVR